MSAELWAIGIDLGATKLEMATVDQRGRLRQQSRISTPDVPEKVEGELARYILDATGDDDQKPAGIGVGVAGQISSDGMMIEFAPNLGWQKVPLGANLARRLDLPVRLLNDVRAATWGEWLYGAGRDCDNLACVFVGTGIGGGIISDGKMLDGHSNTAGEIGHMVVELNGEKCRCGNRGCLEAYAGGRGIARRARDACRDPVAGHLLLQLAGGDAGAVTAKTVSEAASAGDPLARRILSQADEALAAGMISLVHAFNPCRLVFGGGVIQGRPELIQQVREHVLERALPAATRSLEILTAELPQHAAVAGAAAYAMRCAAADQAMCRKPH